MKQEILDCSSQSQNAFSMISELLACEEEEAIAVVGKKFATSF
jgi:hypothetical protein